MKITISTIVFLTSLFYLTTYEALAVLLTVYYFIEFTNDIGNKFNIVEIVIPYLSISCLAVPVLTYHIFSEDNDLAFKWQSFMPIPSDIYFSYTLPAVFLFILGVKFPFKIPYDNFQIYIQNAKLHLANKGNLSIFFLIFGIICTYLVKISPTLIKNIIQNFAYLTYVGLFYAVYSNFKNKLVVIVCCCALVLSQVIGSGMYGELIYMSVLFTLIAIVQRKQMTMRFKVFLVGFGVFALFFIQSIKNEYRAVAWDGLDRNAEPTAFLDIIVNKLNSPIQLFELELVYGMSVRLNQGSIVARTIDYVPQYASHGCGNRLASSFLSAFVPRFLWKNKPMTGGAYNVCRFLGDCESAERGMSYNIGALGEGYAHFGIIGGSIFMFFYGLLMKYIYVFTLRQLPNRPSLLMWYPILYTGYFSMETDVLSFLNTTVKTGMFIAVMFFVLPHILKIKI